MCLFFQLDNHFKVRVVDVSVNPKQPLQDCLAHILEILGEWHTDLRRKQSLVVQLRLNPGHEVVNVFRRRAFNWLFDCYTISPQVLILWSRRHDGARRCCAKLCECAVQHVNLIKKVHCVYCNPLVHVFSHRQLHRLMQIART